MSLSYDDIEQMYQNSAAWRLLRAHHAPLVVSFLNKAFIEKNARVISAPDLANHLEDLLHALRQRGNADDYARPPMEYLKEWSNSGWLRRFYSDGTDEEQFDLTSAAEKAITWVIQLNARQFVGTESRLRTLFDLVAQMSQGSEEDAEKRLESLHKQRAQIDDEINQVMAGNLQKLTSTAIKDRFQQLLYGSRELLSDFREVENHFRLLDLTSRAKITLWDGTKGSLLAEILNQQNAIDESDQGQSWNAFWDYLLTPGRQQEFAEQLEKILTLPAIQALNPESSVRNMHHDWIRSAGHTQKMVASLSKQLRRFLDDKSILENRRIVEVLRSIEGTAINLRDLAPRDLEMSIELPSQNIRLPMERTLHTPVVKPVLNDTPPEADDDEDEDIDLSPMFKQTLIDKGAIRQYIEQCIARDGVVTLHQLICERPLSHGLAELVIYLQLGHDHFNLLYDEAVFEPIYWASKADGQCVRGVKINRAIFSNPEN